MNWKIIHEPYPLDDSVKRAAISAVAFGLFVFVFLRFFQPFGINNWHSSSKTIQLFGYGLVTTFCLFGNFLIFKTLLPKWYSRKTWTVGKNICYTLWMFFTIGFGNLLYSVYCGFLSFNLGGFWFYQSLTLTVGIIPVIFSTLLVYNRRLSSMQKEAESLNAAIQPNEIKPHSIVQIPSNNKSENLSIEVDNLLLIKAIENYVELYYLTQNGITKNIIRTTIKSIVSNFKAHSSIQKCHRSFVVNLAQVESFSGNAQGLTLNFKPEYDLSAPVSRAYVKEIKEKLKN